MMYRPRKRKYTKDQEIHLFGTYTAIVWKIDSDQNRISHPKIIFYSKKLTKSDLTQKQLMQYADERTCAFLYLTREKRKCYINH